MSSIQNTARLPVTSAKPWFPDEDILEIQQEVPKILRGQLAMGDWVKRLEEAAAAMARTKFAVACNSCTAGLEIALKALGIGPGDEVIVPAQTYTATAIAVHDVGAKPVFADVEPDTHCLDPKAAEAVRAPRAKAVLLVHYGGLITPRLEEIEQLCRRRGLKLIEDCAHAHGAARKGRPAGSLGDAASFSYYATKVLTTGEGGMVTTNDPAVGRLARMYQARGMDLTCPDDELFVLPGHNVRMTEFSALCGVLQHRRLEEFLESRNVVADVYARFFESRFPEIVFQRCPPETRHAYWKFTVNLPKGIDRAVLQKQLKEKWNVSANWSYFPAAHLQPVFRELYGTREGQCPVAEDVCARCFNLPMHARLTATDAEYVCEAFESVYKELS